MFTLFQDPTNHPNLNTTQNRPSSNVHFECQFKNVGADNAKPLLLSMQNHSHLSPLMAGKSFSLQSSSDGSDVSSPCIPLVPISVVTSGSGGGSQQNSHAPQSVRRNPFLNHSQCAVCGDKARGCNFGAITCASCKEFFRRNAFKLNVSQFL